MKISFQTILLIIFGAFTVLGVAMFAGYINIGSSGSSATVTGKITIWGVINKSIMNQYLSMSGITNENIVVTYIEKSTSTYEADLVNAFASGTAPDIFMVTPDMYWRQRDKMYEIPYSNYPLATYTSTYMDIGKTYLTPTGILAFPLFFDPLVGYWNKDIFASAGYATAPVEWKEFLEITKKISIVTDDFLIERSAVALGEYTNIRHAKDILSLLFLQAGDPITHIAADGRLTLDFGQHNGPSLGNPAGIALDFYSQFANPTRSGVYSWNKLFTNDFDEFLAGDLGYYFGYGSELSLIRRGNPNLNFDMAFLPQADKNGLKTTTGMLYGLAMSKRTTQLPAAAQTMNDMLSNTKNEALISGLQKNGLTVAPMRRDLLPTDTTNIYQSVLYQSVLVAKGWIDPDGALTSTVWRDMVSDTQSGKSNAINAITTAQRKMSAYLK